MDTRAILNKRISLCPNIHAISYKTITLFEALNSIRKGVYQMQIMNIRKLLQNGNIQSYISEKKNLPSFIFAGIAFCNRHKFDISGYTSLMIVDIDKVENLEQAKAMLISDKFVVSVWISPSGNGLKALLYLNYKDRINEDYWIFHEYCAFPQIANYFMTTYGIQIDKTGADITRLCFVSYYREIHLKNEFEPFPIDITLTNKQIWKIRNKYYYGSKSVRKAISIEKKISKLLKNE
ncbi:MAG: hypothetical protein K2M03_00475 [Muribaculaceae bacterium]|nr:hypothetical protein [Muribaculaceae bacterium]